MKTFIFGKDIFPSWFVNAEKSSEMIFEKDEKQRVVACSFLNKKGIRIRKQIGEEISHDEVKTSYKGKKLEVTFRHFNYKEEKKHENEQ